MKRGFQLTVGTILLVASGARAEAPVRATIEALVERPQNFTERRVIVSAIGCVDNGSVLVCATMVGGRALAIAAGEFGPRTSARDRERFSIGNCRGTANLDRADCRFDVEIAPTGYRREIIDTSAGTIPRVIVNSRTIEVFDPVRY